jgi:hypothetical protein
MSGAQGIVALGTGEGPTAVEGGFTAAAFLDLMGRSIEAKTARGAAALGAVTTGELDVSEVASMFKDGVSALFTSEMKDEEGKLEVNFGTKTKKFFSELLEKFSGSDNTPPVTTTTVPTQPNIPGSTEADGSSN